MTKHTSFNRNPESRHGFSLPSVGMALIIGLIALASAFGLYRSMKSDTDSQAAMTNLSYVAEKVAYQFGSESNFSGLSNSVVVNAGLVPEDWVQGSSIVSGWGAVTLTPGTPNTTFNITLANVPRDACNALGVFRKGSWSGLRIGATTIPQTGNIAATVSTACGDTNTITWSVSK